MKKHILETFALNLIFNRLMEPIESSEDDFSRAQSSDRIFLKGDGKHAHSLFKYSCVTKNVAIFELFGTLMDWQS